MTDLVELHCHVARYANYGFKLQQSMQPQKKEGGQEKLKVCTAGGSYGQANVAN